VLADQLVLPNVGDRYLRFLDDTRAECHRLDIEGFERSGQREAADALRASARDYEHATERFESQGRDMIGAFRRMRDAGVIELWTSAATHAVLPLLATESIIRLQVETGIGAHIERFGRWSGGFWLPECAYAEGLDEQLSLAGVRAFCVDQTNARSPIDQLEPVSCDGAIAVPIDWQTISLVWDERGYPADRLYRDYHAPTINGLRPYANSGLAYAREPAARKAREHAEDFVSRVRARLEEYRAQRGRPGLVVCALDTELLGHWWHEGPLWLSAVVEQAKSTGLRLSTLPEALSRHEPRPRRLHESSWGVGKDLRTWDSPAVGELVWPARRAELQLAGAARSFRPDRDATSAVLRAARELLALESSDWAFIGTRGLAADYPVRRVQLHARAFERAIASARGVKDSRDMSRPAIDPRLRGLAPGLSLSSLLEPPSAWGRPSVNGARP
jgi:1,4-alpha-glucan branching enzyme